MIASTGAGLGRVVCSNILIKSDIFTKTCTKIYRFPQIKFQLQPAVTYFTLQKRSVKVVNVKPREENQLTLPETKPIEASTSVKGVSTSTKVQSSSDMSSSSPTNSTTVVEAVVAKVSDIEDGQMKEVEVEGKSVLLVKEDGQFYAIGNKCTHYGAALSKGAYSKGKVRCPWHGACFNVKTGDIEDYPGLDSVHAFEVSVKGEDVVVKANLANLENPKRVKPTVRKSAEIKKTAVLVGGGPACLVCAQTLREEGFKGRIKMVSKEPHLCYSRIKLSKAMYAKPDDIARRTKDFYDDNEIELLLGKTVISLAPSDSTIKLDDGEVLGYDYLLLGTGGQPRRLPIPGIDMKNVFLLRNIEDANAINNSAKDRNVVIVGSSFIGMEVASYLADKAQSVHVVDLVSVPFQVTLGHKVGTFMQQMHESHGIKFHFETSVKEFRGNHDQVREAVLTNGEVIQTDVVVMGVGVIPATDFLKGSGLEMSLVGFVPVNKKMETNLPGVYAGGDIAEFPLFSVGNKPVNIQHYQMAHQHGKIAALSMVGKPKDISSVPYFWTVQYGKSIRYCGYGPGFDDVILHGNIDEDKFVAFYTKGEQVVAVASLGWDPIVSQVAELMSHGGSIKKAEIMSDPSSAWLPRLQHQ